MDFAKTRWISDINKDLPKFVEDPSKPSWFFDCEVFRNDWMFCFERFDSDEKVVIVNDYDKLVDFIYNRCYILIGYNSNFYDIAILKAVLLKQNVFEISCQMIDDGITVYFSQNNIVPPTWDLLQPTMAGVLGAFCSLKAAEIYFYHVPAVETSVDFMTQDKLTPKQIEETIKYCQTDVSYTKRLFFDTRLKHELESQRMLCDAYNLPYTQYLHRSEAFITNKLLGKKNNAPQLAAYLLPDNSDGFIRSDIYQFYKDHELDLELPSYTNTIGGLECSFGVGGLHGALLQYQNPEGVNIIDVDVTSMYPSIMIKHGIFSRNSVGLQAFEDIFNTRVALKKAKDPKQSAYKLILNATYGSMGSKFYEFADPMMRTTVCIYGQLYITALMEMLYKAGYKLVQVNTDGVMFEDNGTDDWKDICKKWEERTKLGLESIVYTHFYQRDVNNYRAVSEWGDITNRGIFNATTNQPPFISKLLPKLLDNTLSEDITEGLEVWDFVHILSVKGSLRLSDFQACVDENASFSDQMAGIAGNVNLCFVTGNKQGVTDNLVKLYTKVQGYNSHLLKNVEAKDGQIVGLAFIKMALYFTNGNFLVNEIAAQNAYYCIAKNFLIAKNTYALPALFTLFVKRPQTLVDELYNVNPDPTLLGFGGMTPSASYRRRDRAMENRLPIMTYILSKFYDENKKGFLIDTSLPYHIPNQEDINAFHKELRIAKLGNKKEILDKGEEYFHELYEIIDDHLNL